MDDVEQLAGFIQICRASPSAPIIREGEMQDSMLLIIQGRAQIAKCGARAQRQSLTAVEPGMTMRKPP